MIKKAVEIAAPRVREESLESVSLAELAVEEEASFEELRLQGVGSGDATKSRWSQVHFDRARLGGLVWEGAHWQDARFAECDLANANGRHLYGARVEFLGCRLLGFVASESTWHDCLWRDCAASLSQFRFAKFHKVRFEKCDLSGADFQNCDLRGAVFKDCDLRRAQFSFCQLDGADWRGCEIEDLHTNAESLQGLIVTPYQAACFAGLLGLRVSWNEERDLRIS